MKYKMVQLSAGQQAEVNLKSLKQAREESGADFEIVAIADASSERIRFLKERYPEILGNAKEYRRFVELLDAELASGVDVVLDSSPTPYHLENINAAFEMMKMGHNVKIWGSEKPVFIDSEFADFYCNEFAKRGTVILENNIEIYSQPKSVMLDDIQKSCTTITSMSFARAGDVRGKCIKTRRNLFKNYSGSWNDKSIHDVCKALFTARMVGFTEPVVNVRDAHFDFIRFIRDDGSVVYPEKTGSLVKDPSSAPINDSYARVNMSISGINVSMISSFSPMKPDDVVWVNSWLTPEMAKTVHKALGVKPSLIWEKSYNWNETRSERVVATGKDGERITYVTETFGSPFTVKEASGKVDVLYHTSGEYDKRKSNWHQHFIRDIFGCLNGGNPLVGMDQIREETAVMQDVHVLGYKRSLAKGNFYTIDLRKELELRNVWDSNESMRV